MFYRATLRLLLAVFAAGCLNQVGRAEGINWRTNIDDAKLEAAKTDRLLLLHFTATWCGPCKMLERNVLSQPQVGAAVEQQYVPVKVDVDTSPALAGEFRVDTVPTEVVLTPQGDVLATISTPDNPAAYVAQLQNLSLHYRQSAPGGVGTPAVNATYASLPTNASTRGTANTGTASASAMDNAGSQQPQPHVQSNPYVVAPPGGMADAAGTSPPDAATGATAPAPTMPGNAMPSSYRNATASAAQPAASTAAAPEAGAKSVANAVASTAGVAAPTTAAVTSQIPADSPPVGFDGFCPVTLKALNKWAAGNPAFGAIHRGRTYLFVGEQQRQQFLADPDGYSPVFAGYDPVLLLEQRQTTPGTRAFGYRYGGSFYLFSCKETMERFRANPQVYAAGVRQAMARVGGGGDVLRR